MIKMYSREVTYTGLRGGEKKRTVNFVMTRANVLENRKLFEDWKQYQDELNSYAEEHKNNEHLNEEQALRILELGLLVIKVAYAEVDLDDDIVDKSQFTVNRFLNSLAYEALLTEITEEPMLLIEIMKGITAIMPVPEDELEKMNALQQQYVDKTKVQNGDNSGQDIGVSLSPEEVEAKELRARLAVLEGGNQ